MTARPARGACRQPAALTTSATADPAMARPTMPMKNWIVQMTSRSCVSLCRIAASGKNDRIHSPTPIRMRTP